MKNRYAVLISLALSLTLLACVDSQEGKLVDNGQALHLAQAAGLFAGSSVTIQPSLVDCTLSNGTETGCISITTNPTKATHNLGP